MVEIHPKIQKSDDIWTVKNIRFSIVCQYVDSKGIPQHVHIAFPFTNISLTMRNLSRFRKRKDTDYRVQLPGYVIQKKTMLQNYERSFDVTKCI